MAPRPHLSPTERIEGRLVAHHGEGEPVGARADRALDHAAGFAARFERCRVAGEVGMAALTQRLAELEDRFYEFDPAFSGGGSGFARKIKSNWSFSPSCAATPVGRDERTTYPL